MVSRNALIICLSTTLGACANMSTLQTARVVPEGTHRFLVGGGYYASPQLDASLSRLSAGAHKDLKFPYVEVGYRGNLRANNMDWGVKLTFPGTGGLDLKYQFLNDPKFAMAVGLGVAYVQLPGNIPIGVSGSVVAVERTSYILDSILPLYLSYDFSDDFGVYASPKYLLRLVRGGIDGTISMAGVTAGIRIGRKYGVFLEGTYLRDLTANGYGAMQLNAAFFFGSAPATPYNVDDGVVASTSRVVEAPERLMLIYISHEPSRRWKLKEALCVNRGGRDIACGMVTVVAPQRATVRLVYKYERINVGDRVRLVNTR